MARARNIKPGFYKNERLAECSVWARYIFPGLWQMADRAGRLEDRPKRIKGELLPYDTQNVEPLLQELHEADFIIRYEVATVGRFIAILNFTKHQHPHQKEPDSTLPPPAARTGQAPGGTHAKPAADCLPDEAKVSVEPGARTRRARLNPEPREPIPDTGNLKPPSGEKPSAAARRPAEVDDDPAARARPTWKAYIAAIQTRYPGRTVLRDETANSQMAKFVKRVGVDDGPKVAALYVSLNKRRYTDCHHSVATMLSCVEELYSQWTSGLSITEAESRQADQTAARVEQVHRLTREKAA